MQSISSSSTISSTSSGEKNNENNQNNMNTAAVLRRARPAVGASTSPLDASRRHTIVGCHKNFNVNVTTTDKSSQHVQHQQVKANGTLQAASNEQITASQYYQQQPSTSNSGPSSIEMQQSSIMSSSMEEAELRIGGTTATLNLGDKLSLTLEEIIHIRSVMTKAELESLPVGVKVKEEVERRKLCFLCLRTRFSLFGQRGTNCRLCDRTVCSKCFSKMRIPRDQFRHVPVMLLSPSLLSTPAVSNVPSPIHQLHVTGNEESFSRTLMERLMRPDVDRRVRLIIVYLFLY